MNNVSAVYKVGFVLDLHGRNNNPIARMDNYPEAILKKVEYIIEHNDIIVFTGDIFNTYLTGISFINKLMLLLVKAQASGKIIKMIMGNHDIIGRAYDSFLNTSFGTLVIGRNWLLKEAYAPLGFEIVPLTFKENGTPWHMYMSDDYESDPKWCRILVGHCYFNHPEFNDKWNIDKETLKGFDYCVLGHDHTQYEPEEFSWEDEKKTCLLLRSGAISRQTVDEKDLDIKYPQVTISLNHDNEVLSSQATYENVPYAPPEEVFKLIDNSSKDLAQHKKNIDRMIELLQIEDESNDLSLDSVLSEINCPQKYKDIINEVLKG